MFLYDKTTTQNEVVSGSSNRLAKTTDANGTTVRTLTYRQGGDLYTDAKSGGATYTYLYNARKRLVAVKQDATTVANYGYDFQGHRVSRTIFSLLSTTKIHYVYDIEGRLLGEYDGNTGAPLREYAYVGDMPLAVIDTTGTGPNTYFIHTGRLNEPQVMTNATKAKVWDAYVKPYGKAQTFASPTVVNDFRLPGQWKQLEAAAEGLSQNHFRDYDPTLGRYIEADPLGIDAGQNVYAYVDGRPYDAIDREGLVPIPIPMAPPQALPFPVFPNISTPEDVQRRSKEIRQASWEKAKNFCDTPPPKKNDPCADLSSKIDHAKRCIYLYRKWDIMWEFGRHDQKIKDWENRLRNLKKEHKQKCATNCPFKDLGF